MRTGGRIQPFVLVATDHGTMIVHRMDYYRQEHGTIGVGVHILGHGSYEPDEVDLCLKILDVRRHHYGDGVVAIDGGANIGVHTIEWAKKMHRWGKVLAFEPQERIYYALCGNIALNNCSNTSAVHAALAHEPGFMDMPLLDYDKPASFGSLSLDGASQDVGQEPMGTIPVNVVSIDALQLKRLDFLKLDVEGAELSALQGARDTIGRTLPVMLIEHLKTGVQPLQELLEPQGYVTFINGINLLCVHSSDKCLPHIKQDSK